MRIERLSPASYRDLIQPDRVHGSLYTEPYVFEDELDKIFSRGWVFVAHDSELPNPGDYITRTVGRQHFLVVRGQDGAVNVFINRCQHRGNLVCNKAVGNAKNFTCPYHGWVYDSAGRNVEIKDRATGAYPPALFLANSALMLSRRRCAMTFPDASTSVYSRRRNS